MNREKIESLLNELNVSASDIQASALMATDGLMLASVLGSDVDEDIVGAISAALLAIGERAGKELTRGDLELLFIQGKEGYTIISSVGEDAILTVLTSPNAKIGLVFFRDKAYN